jgi:penicillin-binding protein 2
VSADFTTVLSAPQPTILNPVAGSEFLPYIQEGMKQAAKNGTAEGIFDDCPVSVACKTGTVQSEVSLSDELVNNGVFVCYAPADKPQIAISIVVERGTSGATIADIAKDIIDYYFRTKPDTVAAQDNKLQP